MSSQIVADFFSIVLFGAVIGVLASFTPRVREALRPSALPLAALVAVTATAGSLYFSEVAGFVPCELCWYQRIAMYPLAVVLGVAAMRSDLSARRHGLPLAVIGLLIAIYHVQLQAFPDQSSFCALDHPCTISPTAGLGFLTIPQMSALSFAAVIRLLSLVPTTPKGDPHGPYSNETEDLTVVDTQELTHH